MKPAVNPKLIRRSVMTVLFLLVFAGPGIAASYAMIGEITAIDLKFNTIVVQVPMGDRLFTVGGPLAAEARLFRQNRDAGLEAFNVGETVVVRWHSTKNGHIIDRLTLR
jgi:hypothetical protein